MDHAHELDDPVALARYGADLFRGEYVRLRGVRDADMPQLTALIVDPRVSMTARPSLIPESEDGARDFLAKLCRNASPVSAVGFAIEALVPSPAPLVGFVGLMDVSLVRRHAELTVVVEPDHQGEGYGTDALRVLQRYAFEHLGLHRLELETYDFNRRAQAIYERLGFVEEGRRREVVPRGGRRYDCVLMGQLAAEWRSGCSGPGA